ncbi:Eco57I restriction-modification methylase domain-containing protein [Hydrogenovibrio halophilus]|uniref:Eco57I restriction-modification methylase domain-containing protein n=1 Tax=Hydrogenovibrio halophilus TaxID=373391 RepID=UPI0003810F54|nr:N-6 DNA methylase [Hydrogenovibrio halophilus]
MLFHPKILARHLHSLRQNPIPENHLKGIQSWKQRIEIGDLQTQNEVALHAPFMQQIMVDILGYVPYGSDDTYTIAREYPIAKQGGKGAVDLALGHFDADKTSDRILAPFELKGAKTKDLDAIMSGRHKSPVQQAWEYARDIKGCQWVLVSNYLEIRLYSVSETSLVFERFDLTELDQPEQYWRFVTLLSADNLLQGATQALLEESHQADRDITDQLYLDYKVLRQNLIVHLIQENPDRQPIDLIQPAQKLLDRMLFIAFAEDKGLIPDNSIQQAYEHADPYNPRPIYDNFKGLFKAVDQGNAALKIPAYNGGLFAQDPFLDGLQVSDAICESFKNLAEYDFDSDVSVTVLGHIFEQSIADLEELIEQIESGDLPQFKRFEKTKSVKGKRKQHGVVYTPDAITTFIVEHTLGAHIQERFHACLQDFGQLKKDETIQWKRGKQTELKFWYAWQDELKQIKVVDPACGSGAFLVAAFDHLHREYQRINDKLAELTGQPGVFDLNKEILNHNLYGVDINAESIEISKLSLWLKTAERGKALTSLDANLQTGNSLGVTEPVPGSDFCWQQAFADIVEQGGFDVVLGNPPYVRQERLGEIKPWLAEHYQVYHGVVDLYAYFFELGMNLLKPGGKLGFISSSTFFKTGSGAHLRRFLAEQTTLKTAVDFGDLQVFEGVTTYPAILVFENSAPQPDSQAEMLVLKDRLPANLGQTFEQEKSVMVQSQLQGDSWQLEDARLYQLRHKLTHDQDGQPYPILKDVYGSPYRGVLTGLNDAFVIDRATRDRIVAQDPHSAELIKPFLEGKDLKKWHAQPRDRYLIFTRRGTDIDRYPGIKAHLEQYKERLMPKPKDWPKGKKWPGRKSGPYQWYEIQDTVGYFQEFENPKIFYPDITDSSKLHLDQKGSFSGNTGYFFPHWKLLCFGFIELQFGLVWFYLTGIADAVRGGFYRMFSQNLNRIPMPDVNESQKSQISELAETCQTLTEQRFAVESGFARRLSEDLCPDDKAPKLNKNSQAWWKWDFKTLQKELKKSFKLKAKDVLIPVAERNDWQAYFETEKAKIDTLNQQIQTTETQLNQAVYQLFELTEEEIELIEQNL